MKRVKLIIFLCYGLNIILSLALAWLCFSKMTIYSKNKDLGYLFSLSIFLSVSSTLYILQDFIMKKIFNKTEKFNAEPFQLKGDIIVKPRGEQRMATITFISFGKEVEFIVPTALSIGVYKEMTWGTVRLKKNKIFNIVLFVRQYENNNKNDFYAFYQEPISIDHMRLKDYEDYKIREGKKYRPRLYVVK